MPKGVSAANQEAESTNEEECTRPTSKFVCALRIDTHKRESDRTRTAEELSCASFCTTQLLKQPPTTSKKVQYGPINMFVNK